MLDCGYLSVGGVCKSSRVYVLCVCVHLVGGGYKWVCLYSSCRLHNDLVGGINKIVSLYFTIVFLLCYVNDSLIYFMRLYLFWDIVYYRFILYFLLHRLIYTF